MAELPIVDLSEILNPEASTAHYKIAAEKFGTALKFRGFVYLRNHGIPQESIDEVFSTSKSFFEQPFEVKNQFKRDYEGNFHGYNKIGEERLDLTGNFELRESFDVQSFDYGIGIDSNLPYPNPEFEAKMNGLMAHCKILGLKICRLLGIALGLEDEDYIVKCHQNLVDSSVANFTQLRTLFYPPISRTPIPGTVGCGEHTDYGTVTVLFQDAFDGLEVLGFDGSWISAKPIPGCVLINVGDLMYFWTGGIFPSTIHRVMIPEGEARQKNPRQSIAFFMKPDNSVLIKPIVMTEKCKEKGFPIDGVYPGEHFLKRTLYHRDIASAPVLTTLALASP